MDHYTMHIKAKTGWFDIDFKELYQYRDLIFLFVKRDYSTRYKQTILGPLWLVLNPLLTVSLYAFVFGHVAGLPTDGAPPFAFYLCSNAIWSYFAACINHTATTFTANAAIMGKVYFPRLVMPISSVVTGMLDLLIQLAMLVIVIMIYMLNGVQFHFGVSLMLVPISIIQTALLGLGSGIIVASLTTRYRDLSVLAAFGVQLWMYASPVVYTISQLSPRIQAIYMLNPMAPIIEVWRHAILGIGGVPATYYNISWIITFVLLSVGVVIFNQVEKIFMDTV